MVVWVAFIVIDSLMWWLWLEEQEGACREGHAPRSDDPLAGKLSASERRRLLA